jgi:SAM-dependent methyltransferase
MPIRAPRQIREFRRIAGRPWRWALTLSSRALFARGQLETSQRVFLNEVGLDSPNRSEYAPSGWLFTRRMLRGFHVTSEDVFVDFGSGMGRAVYMVARRYGFGRVIGVEIAPEFNRTAAANIERTRHKLRCRNVEFVTCDAVEYEVPDDMTYAYFFNPFMGEVFERVISNICRSMDRRPRRVVLIYARPIMEAAILRTGRFELVRSTTGLRRDIPNHRISVYVSTPGS